MLLIRYECKYMMEKYKIFCEKLTRLQDQNMCLFINVLHFNMTKVKAVSNFRHFPLSHVALFTCNYVLSALDNVISHSCIHIYKSLMRQLTETKL